MTKPSRSTAHKSSLWAHLPSAGLLMGTLAAVIWSATHAPDASQLPSDNVAWAATQSGISTKTGRAWFTFEGTPDQTAAATGLPVETVEQLTHIVEADGEALVLGTKLIAVADLVYEAGRFRELGQVHAVLKDDGRSRDVQFHHQGAWYDRQGTGLVKGDLAAFQLAIAHSVAMLSWDDTGSLGQHVVPTELDSTVDTVAIGAPIIEDGAQLAAR